MPWSFIVIPLLVATVAGFGSWFTNGGMGSWYRNLIKPSWTPSGSFIGIVWTVIYVLCIFSAVLFWNLPYWQVLGGAPDFTRLFITLLFLLNGVLNAYWSYLFFRVHRLGASVVEIFFLIASVYVLIGYLWPFSDVAAWLLVPYAAWVTFAGVLNYEIWKLNRKKAGLKS